MNRNNKKSKLPVFQNIIENAGFEIEGTLKDRNVKIKDLSTCKYLKKYKFDEKDNNQLIYRGENGKLISFNSRLLIINLSNKVAIKYNDEQGFKIEIYNNNNILEELNLKFDYKKKYNGTNNLGSIYLLGTINDGDNTSVKTLNIDQGFDNVNIKENNNIVSTLTNDVVNLQTLDYNFYLDVINEFVFDNSYYSADAFRWCIELIKPALIELINDFVDLRRNYISNRLDFLQNRKKKLMISYINEMGDIDSEIANLQNKINTHNNTLDKSLK